MTTRLTIKDNATGNLLTGINASTSSIVLESGDGANFPSPTTNVPCILTIVQYSTPSDPTSSVVKREKIRVTDITGDTLTVTERGVGDTTAQSFNAGDFVDLNVVVDVIDGIYSELDSFPADDYRRNSVINGKFNINQRGVTTTLNSTGSTVQYVIDRFADFNVPSGGTLPTMIRTRQTLTTGNIPNTKYYSRINFNGAGSGLGSSSQGIYLQRIERGTQILGGASIAGSSTVNVTVSFFARSNITNKRLGVNLYQNYGSGGSPTLQETISGMNWQLSSTFTRYSQTFTLNTLAGKTLGSNDDDYLQLNFWYAWGSSLAGGVSIGSAETYGGSGNIDITDVVLSVGSSAATSLIRQPAQELANCQRYFERIQPITAGTIIAPGYVDSPSVVNGNLTYTQKRTTPVITFGGSSPGIGYSLRIGGAGVVMGSSTLTSAISETRNSYLTVTNAGTSFVIGQACLVQFNSAGSFIDVDSEL